MISNLKFSVKRTIYFMVCLLPIIAIGGTIFDFVLAFNGYSVPIRYYIPCMTFIWIISALLCKMFAKFSHPHPGLIVTCIFLVFMALIIVLHDSFYYSLRYGNADDGKENLYSSKKVMVLVPHEDDELNIGIGILSEYVRYGSEVYLVFVTNGDYRLSIEERFYEAIAAGNQIGITDDHIIFLGYGDQYHENRNIYNAKEGEVLVSVARKTETYGTVDHPAYHEGNLYTRINYLADIKSIIMELKPDVILTTDYDDHPDHIALTLGFDTVMGEILHNCSDYRPTVYKAYAYNTAWYAPDDYFAEDSVVSTKNPYDEPRFQKPETYLWSDRIRFPVSADMLSHALFNSDGYQLCGIYVSQNVENHAASILNGDQVFWKRDTESLTYRAKIMASSGDPSVLNDFKIIDNTVIADYNHMPYDGLWCPSENDEKKTVTINLGDVYSLQKITLYDNPSPESNIIDSMIIFSDGTAVHTGPLNAGGAATEVIINKSDVSEFTLQLCEWEGENPGLTEIEAYSLRDIYETEFIKIENAEENFIYDYYIDPSGAEQFMLYIYGNLPSLNENDYLVECDNQKCKCGIEAGKINVTCPKNEICTITVRALSSSAADSVIIKNPSKLYRFLQNYVISHEENIYENKTTPWYRDTVLYRVNQIVMRIVR